MAYAAPLVTSTKETTNYARLCRLLVDVGAQALRDTFDAIHAPGNLHVVLSANKSKLKALETKKIIHPIQWGKLFPVIPTTVSSRDFDITLLMVLLRNICGLIAPPTGWDTLPHPTDLSREADIIRIRYYRNTIYGHAEKAYVDDNTFNVYWIDIRDTLVRLGNVKYSAAVDSLKNECMDPQVQDHYKELLREWKKDEDSVKDQLDEIKKMLGDLTASKEITSEPLASTKATYIPDMCKEPYHENEALQYYCEDCGVCICLKCRQTRHKQHSQVDIQKAAEEKKVQRRKIVDRAKAGVVCLEAKIDEQSRLMNKSEEENVATQHKVTETVEEVIRLLRDHEAQMKMQLTKINETQQREHATRLEELQLCVKQLKTSIEYDEDVLQKTAVLEMLQPDNAVFSLSEEDLNTQQENKLYRSQHVRYVLNQETLNVLKPLVLGQVVSSLTDPSKSLAEGTGLMESQLGVEANFKVTTRDSEENQVYDENDQVIVKICTPSGEDEKKDTENCRDGSYMVRYKPKSLGLYDVRIEVNGQQLRPCSVQVIYHYYKLTNSFQDVRGEGSRQPVLLFPWSIAQNERTALIAVADYSNKIIHLLDKQWKWLDTIICSEGRHYADMGRHPISLAFLRNGDLLFTYERVAHDEKMAVYSALNRSIVPSTKHVIRPLSVFVKTEGDGQVVVCDVGDKTIKVLSPDLTALLQSFSPPKCNESPEFVVHKNGTFFASYQRLHCVKVFNDEGVFLRDIGSYGCGDGQLNRPIGLAVDAFNQLIVCDHGNCRVLVFTVDGDFIYSIANEDNDGLNPWFVTVSNNDEIMISDVDNQNSYTVGRIRVFK